MRRLRPLAILRRRRRGMRRLRTFPLLRRRGRRLRVLVILPVLPIRRGHRRLLAVSAIRRRRGRVRRLALFSLSGRRGRKRLLPLLALLLFRRRRLRLPFAGFAHGRRSGRRSWRRRRRPAGADLARQERGGEQSGEDSVQHVCLPSEVRLLPLASGTGKGREYCVEEKIFAEFGGRGLSRCRICRRFCRICFHLRTATPSDLKSPSCAQMKSRLLRNVGRYFTAPAFS